MIPFQVQFEAWLRSFPSVAAFMQTPWAWPAVESAHFIGLTLLFGSIAAWDLRLVGLLKEVPVSAFHKLVPFAALGFAINVASGSMFLVIFSGPIRLQPGVSAQAAVPDSGRPERDVVLPDELPSNRDMPGLASSHRCWDGSPARSRSRCGSR